MRRLALLCLAVVAALALPGHARAVDQCGLPSAKPVWVDFATVELESVFARPGVVLATSSGTFPARVRAKGAKTIHWDMYLNRRVGTPTAPAPAESIPGRANSLFDYAAVQSGCDKPLIVLNELFGAQLETPWTPSNTRYRENVLAFVRTLAERGARPYLLISRLPYTGSEEARAWWREVGRLAYVVPEVYFHGPTMWQVGPVAASRRMRVAFRTAVRAYLALGIPPQRIGLVLGFQTASGIGGREGLDPDEAWFEVVKWQVLAAKQVARETGLGTIVSWGWASYTPTRHDVDKPATGCVYLWARVRSLCDGPAVAGPRFDASLTAGQLRLRAGVQCSAEGRAIGTGQLAALQRLTGDRDVAFTALLARLAEAPSAAVPTSRVLAAERAVVATRFGGSAAAYRAALARAGASVAIAREILRDELRRMQLEQGLRARRATPGEVATFYASYPDLLVRPVEAKPGPWWLGGRTTGLALQPLVEPRLLELPGGRRSVLRGFDGPLVVRPLGETVTLGSVPLEQARPSIAAALAAFGRRQALESWTVARQEQLLLKATCRGDELPTPGAVGLSAYLPFLARV